MYSNLYYPFSSDEYFQCFTYFNVRNYVEQNMDQTIHTCPHTIFRLDLTNKKNRIISFGSENLLNIKYTKPLYI